jgi:tetratricopeptide (TPR) repeat protein
MRALLTPLLVTMSCQAFTAPTDPRDATPPLRSDAGVTLAAADFGAPRVDFQRPDVAPKAPPLSLTASDGTGLDLVVLDAKTVVTGPLAFTELRLVFRNPEDRVREGRFEITLPDGAAISRFAMNIDGQWQEGEVVERMAAQRIYEDFLHQRQDPALLEHDAGNQFRARVFPIAPRADKELVLSWSQEITDSRAPLRLPLAGLPEIDQLDVEVRVAGTDRAWNLHRERSAPDGDVAVWPGAPSQVGLRDGNLVAVRVAPLFAVSADPVDDLTLLVDTSASRALTFDAQLDGVGALVAALRADGDFPLRVVAFDQSTDVVFEGRSSEFGAAHLERLRARGAMGASDLGRALDGVRGSDRVVLVTDGVATAGDVDAAVLREQVAALGGRGVERLDVVVDGSRADAALLRTLTTALPASGVVLDGELGAARLAERLDKAAARGLTVEVPGAQWVWPQTLDGVQPGDEVVVFADLDPARPVEVRVGGRSQGAIPTAPAVRPLLEREWVDARMSRLAHLRDQAPADDVDYRAAMTEQITRLSVEHRVLTDTTALLVLESEQDYARYGLDRAALADVMVVGSSGIEVVRRQGRNAPPIPTFPVFERPVDRTPWNGPMPDDAAMEGEAAPLAAAPEEFDGTAGLGAAQAISAPRSAPAEARRERGDIAASRSHDVVLDEVRMASPTVAPTPPPEPSRSQTSPWTGRFSDVQRRLDDDPRGAVVLARSWTDEAPGDVLAWVALGEALEATRDPVAAARAYGSIIDLFPSRADLRRMAGERLDRLGSVGVDLAEDTYGKARAQRPDHPSGHRQHAWSLVALGRHEEAFAAFEDALGRTYPNGRFAGVDRVLREDAGLVAAAWLRAEPARADEIRRRAQAIGATPAATPSLRFALTWETDANDVDLHVYDAKGGHASYQSKVMPSGGELFADVTTGYGPECFAVNGRTYGPYRLQTHYYRQGPLGYGMGTVQVIRHDGQGGLSVEHRPFVIMQDDAWLELGTVDDGAVAKR